MIVASSDATAQTQAGATAPKEVASSFQIYGFAQADAIFEFGQSDPNWFDVNRPTKLPSFDQQYGADNRFWLSARQSRIGVKTSGMLGTHAYKTKWEFDLFGVGADAGQTTIRPRSMYGQWGQVGAGQLETPFMDADLFPNILEYWGPNGMLFFRNVQVFWKPIEKENGTSLTFALERPGASGDQGLLSDRIELQNIRGRFPWPDFSAGYKLAGSWGYGKLGAIVRDIRWDDILVDTLDLAGGTVGWGVSLSGGINAGSKDVLRLSAVYGEGIQNYFNDAPVDVGVKTNFGDRRRPIVGEALPIVGLMAYLDHRWDKEWTSSIGYSRVDIDNSNLQANNAFRVGQYASVNLLNTPVQNVLIGGEVQWANRENFRDGFSVNDVRLQFSFKYSFSHTMGGNDR
jgi:hypothetical protein